MGVTAHGVTHPGPRASNEDAFLIDTTGGVFVVADGMGGHNAGEVAAGLAVESIRTFVSDEDQPTAGGLEDAVRAANRNILDTAARRPECAGMGTTVAVALVTPTGARGMEASHENFVGDSRARHSRARVDAELRRRRRVHERRVGRLRGSRWYRRQRRGR